MKDTKHIRRDFPSAAWVMPQGWDLGALGCPVGQIIFFKHGHVAYRADGDDEQNRMQVTFSSLGQTGDLGGKVKRSNIINMSISKILYQTLCVFSQIKDRKHIVKDFHSVARVGMGLLGGGGRGESKTLAWGFAMVPHRLRALVFIGGGGA